jgi:hypothetical protein
MVPAVDQKTASGEVFLVALPRLVITLDATGKPGIEGLPIEDIAKAFGYELDLGLFRIDPFYPNWMTNTNIQHIELRQTGKGLALLVNGAPMPHVGWSDQSLNQTADLAPLVLLQKDIVKKLVPVVTRLGLDIVLKFPLASGAKPIPYASDEVALAAAAAAEGPGSAVMHFEIKYDENGVPSILGISAQDLAALGINAPLALHPYYVGVLQANNIQHMELRTKGDGVWIYINGTPLPNIVWDKKMVASALDVYAQMNPGISDVYMKLITMFVPVVTNADVAVLVHFPLAPGATPIPAKMH